MDCFSTVNFHFEIKQACKPGSV